MKFKEIKNIHYKLFLITLFILFSKISMADNGYRLWLKYDKIKNEEYLNKAEQLISGFKIFGQSETIKVAQKELERGLSGLFGKKVGNKPNAKRYSQLLLVGTPASSKFFKNKTLESALSQLKEGGYIIKEVGKGSKSNIVIVANDDVGVLYGVFHFLRLLQTQSTLVGLNIISSPDIALRMLNHWDNLDRSVERGYAGKSLWKWKELPEKIDSRYKVYARANASIGINGVVLNNVNADPEILSKKYLRKVAALAKVFRPYGIKVFLSANFAAPKVLGHLSTADPLDKTVIAWWKNKADEIYQLIPDFGGFLVKANSEGQPGPQDYGRSHAQGANMMAKALQSHGGVLIWRAFVYAMKKGEDRAKMAYEEFKGLDGKFEDNVLLQIKNGPLDFQPREPFSPLFGAMPQTNEMMEFQITQEYLGHSKALVYLAPLFKEALQSDTYAEGEGSTVARIIDGTIQHQTLTGIAGVANIGSDSNWCGYIFVQANWFAFGRLAWNPNLTSKEIATEWIKMTLSHQKNEVNTIRKMMLLSREALVNYETPLGLNVLCGYRHYNPNPSIRQYYHKADSMGLGFNRTTSGSDAVSQYFPAVRDSFNNIETCPEKYLAWFHHVPWNYTMESGRTFWNELCYKYYSGVESVERMQDLWNGLKGKMDRNIYYQTKKLLVNQKKEAVKWKTTCLGYFSSFSEQSIPEKYK